MSTMNSRSALPRTRNKAASEARSARDIRGELHCRKSSGVWDSYQYWFAMAANCAFATFVRRLVSTNCVEKLRLIEAPGADSLLLGGGDSVDDGRTAVIQEALFYGFSLERHAPDSH